MNDFTKEELERILEGVSWWLDGESALYSEKLIEKIQSMIDNYCDHLDSTCVKHCFGCQVSEHRCDRCGKIKYEDLE